MYACKTLSVIPKWARLFNSKMAEVRTKGNAERAIRNVSDVSSQARYQRSPKTIESEPNSTTRTPSDDTNPCSDHTTFLDRPYGTLVCSFDGSFRRVPAHREPGFYAAEAQKAHKAPGAVAAVAAVPQAYVTTGFPQVVVVSGTNYEMGVQYGEQAAAAIVHNVALFKSRLYDKFGSDKVTKDMQAWDYYLKKHDPVYADWLRGIMEGCKRKGYAVTYLDLIALMVYPTEFWARPKAPYPAETRIASIGGLSAPSSQGEYHACTTFAAAGAKTPDGKPIHAITSMSPTETMDNIILLAFPKEGASFVSQTYAGRVNGNYAMNSKGFSWTMTAIMSDNPAWGMPPEVSFHYLAQMGGSLGEGPS